MRNVAAIEAKPTYEHHLKGVRDQADIIAAKTANGISYVRRFWKILSQSLGRLHPIHPTAEPTIATIIKDEITGKNPKFGASTMLWPVPRCFTNEHAIMKTNAGSSPDRKTTECELRRASAANRRSIDVWS